VRNLARYPLAAEEAASICDRVAHELLTEMRLGDMRPHALMETARFLRANIEQFEDFVSIRPEDSVVQRFVDEEPESCNQ
jgi:hypothetical protein